MIEAPACDATVVYLAPCAFLDCAQVTGNPGVISSPVGLVPTNALVLTEPINSETIVREHLVAWSVAGGSGLKCPTPQKRGWGKSPHERKTLQHVSPIGTSGEQENSLVNCLRRVVVVPASRASIFASLAVTSISWV